MKMKKLIPTLLLLTASSAALAHGDHESVSIFATLAHYLTTLTHLPVPMLIGATAIAAVMIRRSWGEKRWSISAFVLLLSSVLSL